MTRYERVFGTDWTSLTRDEATARAYAIGVAEKLGEGNRDELTTIYHEMDSAYDKSMVELAYQEGRREATQAVGSGDRPDEDVWNALVVEEYIPPEQDSPMGGRDGIPKALGLSDLLDRLDVKSTATDRPEFLER